MKLIKYIVFMLKTIYYRVRLSGVVFNLVNYLLNFLYKFNKSNNDKINSSIVDGLKKNGYVVMPVSNLLNKEELIVLQDQAKEALETIRRMVQSVEKNIDGKNYLKRYTQCTGLAPLTDLLATETISGRIYEIACMYFNTIPRITNIDYWLNVPEVPGTRPIASQIWHRDYEDKKLLKVFVYFTDVDEKSGAFSVVSKTHYGSADSKVFPTKPPLGVTVSDIDVNERFGTSRIKQIEAPSLTAVFVDTSALHRGGYCVSGERFLFTSTFTSFAGISPRLFSVPKSISCQLDRLTKLSLTK